MVAYIVVQYARFLAFKCLDSPRAVEIMNQAIAKCQQSTGSAYSRGAKTLYLSYVNFLKHLEAVIPDVYTKIVQVFEKAIEETVSGLGLSDRQEIARFYLEYLQENCQTVGFLRSTEAAMKSRGLISNTASSAIFKRDESNTNTNNNLRQSEEFSVSQTGNQIQRDQGLYGVHSADDAHINLGKRAQQ